MKASTPRDGRLHSATGRHDRIGRDKGMGRHDHIGRDTGLHTFDRDADVVT